ncbi:MAG: ABC transporter permease [Verrucomicrobiaceae bacterium]|nr:MAG: ABC transporter permease [Verrucomicrobiaceae bacterium]
MKKELGIFILLVVLCLVTAANNPNFLSATNLTNMANSIGLYGVFSLGLGLVIITGGIDLSVGSICALTGVILSMALTEWNWPWPLAALAVLLIPMILGGVHGVLVTRMRLQPFIVTLCGLLLYRGIARFIAEDGTKGFGGADSFATLRSLASGKLLGVPMPFVLLVIIGTILWVVLHRSVYGRYLLAVGRNEEAARFSGINTRLVTTGAYIIAGLLTGLSGIMIAFYTNSVSPSNHGNFYELYAIAAAVLGGCSLRGGEGSVIGIIIGTALLQVLQNLVNLLGIPSSLNFAVMGAVVLLGVMADQMLRRRTAAR